MVAEEPALVSVAREAGKEVGLSCLLAISVVTGQRCCGHWGKCSHCMRNMRYTKHRAVMSFLVYGKQPAVISGG